MKFESSESDDEIVRRLRDTGDAEIFSLLIDRHGRKVFFFCLRYFSNEQSAQDAVQDTFLQAYQKIHSYQAGNFQGWLMTIARNTCNDAYRRSKMFSEVELEDMAASLSFEDSYESRDYVEKLYREIRSLPDDQRQCICMKVEGYSYEETALLLGLPLKSVKSHIQNGRRMLWKKIQEFSS